ncbi:MAG: cell division protein FtsA [Myxococcota bacterium]|nr:cell division protein FtsA [Myxococcota bacterium]
MNAPGRDSIVVGLDIGTTKVACVIGERNGAGGVDIVGIGAQPSAGLRKGVVINIDDTVRSIEAAVEEAEMMAGVQVASVYAGIAGGHIRSLNSQGMVPIKTGQVGPGDVERVMDTAQALAIPLDREVLHVIAQEFLVDDQEGIEDPRGMSGVRLAAKVHIVTAAVTAAQNVVRCCNLTGLSVRDIVLGQLASSEAVLSQDEKDLGVALIDIGGGTTDVAVYAGGAVAHTHVLPIGGAHITSDIAYGLRAPIKVAETIKQRHGCAVVDMVEVNESFDVPHVGGDKVHEASRRMLSEFIQPRVEEIFSLVRTELSRCRYEDMFPAGVVLTGGATLLPGLPEVAERVFGLPARRGAPRGIGGLADVVDSPVYSTGVGLVKFGFDNYRPECRWSAQEAGMYTRIKSRMTEWLGLAF